MKKMGKELTLTKRQKNFLNQSNLQLTICREEFTGQRYFEFSIYDFDRPASEEEASILVIECKKLFNIAEIKIQYFLLRVLQKQWSKRRFQDAIAYAFANNKYATKNVGIEPGLILSYDRRIRLYNYEQMINYGDGLKTIKMPGVQRKKPIVNLGDNNNYTNIWWINPLDYELLIESIS